jgi:hypothetical protein
MRELITQIENGGGPSPLEMMNDELITRAKTVVGSEWNIL